MTRNEKVQARIDELLAGRKFGRYDAFKARTEVSELFGKTLIAITGAEVDGDAILFECSDGSAYLMYHDQNCCESVDINDICGDVKRLLGNPLTKAEKTSSADDPSLDPTPDDEWGTHTWTYYHLATVKGYVDIRWYGSSNGYYSESVDFIRLRSGN